MSLGFRPLVVPTASEIAPSARNDANLFDMEQKYATAGDAAHGAARQRAKAANRLFQRVSQKALADLGDEMIPLLASESALEA